jgi:hypothetical protein
LIFVRAAAGFDLKSIEYTPDVSKSLAARARKAGSIGDSLLAQSEFAIGSGTPLVGFAPRSTLFNSAAAVPRAPAAASPRLVETAYGENN